MRTPVTCWPNTTHSESRFMRFAHMLRARTAQRTQLVNIWELWWRACARNLLVRWVPQTTIHILAIVGVIASETLVSEPEWKPWSRWTFFPSISACLPGPILLTICTRLRVCSPLPSSIWWGRLCLMSHLMSMVCRTLPTGRGLNIHGLKTRLIWGEESY